MKSLPVYIVALVLLASAAVGFAMGGAKDIAISLCVAAIPIVVIGATDALCEYLDRKRPMGD